MHRAVKITNQVLSELKLQKHPNKTFIGSIAKGFDFLGYHFCPQGLRVAQSTLSKFFTKAARLYEQSPSTPEGIDRVGRYVIRWLVWASLAHPTNLSQIQRSIPIPVADSNGKLLFDK